MQKAMRMRMTLELLQLERSSCSRWRRMADLDDSIETERDSFGFLSDEESRPESVTKEMTVSDVCSYLQGEGIPAQYCDVFKENYIDGMEFHLLKEEDVRAMVPPIGLARKITRLLPKSAGVTDLVTPSKQSSQQLLPTASTSTASTSTASTSSTSGSSKACSTPKGDLEIPDHWRPEVEIGLQDECPSVGARNEIVRTLVNLLFSRENKPSRFECEELARKLIMKYPFLKDDLGNGYQSWADKMLERIRNVRKRDSKKLNKPLPEGESPPAKRKTKGTEILRRYPTTQDSTFDNSESIEKHMKAMETELAKPKPRDTVLLPLMKSTFATRRLFVLNEADSVSVILEKYPALSRPAIIEQEMSIINGGNDIKATFFQNWNMKYVPAIISYGQSSAKKNIRSFLTSLEVTDDTSKQLTAMKILAESFSKCKQALCYLYEEYSDADTVDSACSRLPKRTQPRIAAFRSDGATEYLILSENRCLCKCANLQSALFTTFASYYCFNLDYPKQAKSLFDFLQDYILGHPDSNKKSGSYLAVVSDIKRNL